MPSPESKPRDPREKRKPKDSEFYQIPPDLKKEFEVLMAGRDQDTAIELSAREAMKSRKLGRASVGFAILGAVLIGIGPLLAVILGIQARRYARRAGGPMKAPAAAGLGIILGVAMAFANALTLYLLFCKFRNG